MQTIDRDKIIASQKYPRNYEIAIGYLCNGGIISTPSISSRFKQDPFFVGFPKFAISNKISFGIFF